MRLLQCVLFATLLTGTFAIAAAQQQDRTGQTVTNALHDQRLSQIEHENQRFAERYLELEKHVAEQKSTQDRIIGLGIGIGVTMTTLQGLMLILTFKSNRNK